MTSDWEQKRILITVKTYPTPAWKGGETVCTAGITEDGNWIRLFPIPYRLLEEAKQFGKYQWIEAQVRKATSDARAESYNINIDSIEIVGSESTKDFWKPRKEIVFPLLSPSMCELQRQRAAGRLEPTLGIFKPKVIRRLRIEDSESEWSQADLDRMQQMTLIEGGSTLRQLQRIPFNFYYDYTCEDADCRGHKMTCTDWEMAQAYRNWSRSKARGGYGPDWEAAFRNKFETEMIQKNDTHFYVGTMHGHPGSWIIIGLFYPRLAALGISQAALTIRLMFLPIAELASSAPPAA